MRIAFGEFQLDLDGCELTRANRSVALERRPTELLCLLASRAAELVGRRELADRIWGSVSGVDVDMSINTAIRKIRAALGDMADTPLYVQTVQGRGYRFIATVRPVASADIAVLLGPITIAVWPFDNLTGSSEHDYVADGFTEELIAALGAVSPDLVRVIGRRSVIQFRASHEDGADIGRLLGADHLLEGSIRLDDVGDQGGGQQSGGHRGGTLRVTTRLIEARTGRQVWSESFDGSLDHKLVFQRSVSRIVSDAVRDRFAPHAGNHADLRHTQHEAAYELYLRGRHCWNRNQSAMNTEATGYFMRATAADPDYSLAWSGLADTHSSSPINADAPAANIWATARQAASNAVRTGPQLAEAVASLGFVRFWLDWCWQDAADHFRRAASLDPNYAFAHRMVGVACSHLGLHDEARRAIRVAVERDPLFAMHHALSAVVALHAGVPAQAASFARDAITVDPGFWIGHFQLAQAMEQCGEPQAALAALAVAGRLSGNSTKPAMLAAYIHARQGDGTAARAQLASFAEMARTRFVPPYASALIHAGLGDAAAALDALEQALAVRDVNLCFLPCDPKWRGWHGLPAIRSVIDRCAFTGSPVSEDGPHAAVAALQMVFRTPPWSRAAAPD